MITLQNGMVEQYFIIGAKQAFWNLNSLTIQLQKIMGNINKL